MMLKQWVFLIYLLICSNLVTGQDIKESKVPKVIINLLNSEYSNAKQVHWYLNENTYSASFNYYTANVFFRINYGRYECKGPLNGKALIFEKDSVIVPTAILDKFNSCFPNASNEDWSIKKFVDNLPKGDTVFDVSFNLNSKQIFLPLGNPAPNKISLLDQIKKFFDSIPVLRLNKDSSAYKLAGKRKPFVHNSHDTIVDCYITFHSINLKKNGGLEFKDNHTEGSIAFNDSLYPEKISLEICDVKTCVSAELVNKKYKVRAATVNDIHYLPKPIRRYIRTHYRKSDYISIDVYFDTTQNIKSVRIGVLRMSPKISTDMTFDGKGNLTAPPDKWMGWGSQ